MDGSLAGHRAHQRTTPDALRNRPAAVNPKYFWCGSRDVPSATAVHGAAALLSACQDRQAIATRSSKPGGETSHGILYGLPAAVTTRDIRGFSHGFHSWTRLLHHPRVAWLVK